jgi:hypothetical protein
MLKTLLATSAVAALAAFGVQAQDAPAAGEQPIPPRVEGEMAPDSPMVEDTEAEGAAPAESVAEDPAAKPPADTMAEDPATEAPADTMAEDPAVTTPADTMAEDPATETPADTMAEDPAAPAPADTMAEDPAVTPPADTMAEDPAATPPADTMAEDPAVPLEDGWSEVDVATISTDSLIGADIRTYDQETVASIQDVLLSPDGQAESVVARFGGFLGFGETTVLVTMEELTVVKDADENLFVLTNLTPEALKDRPVYEEVEG